MASNNTISQLIPDSQKKKKKKNENSNFIFIFSGCERLVDFNAILKYELTVS